MNYKDIPAGEFSARAVRIGAGKSSQKGTPFIEVEFHIAQLDANLRWTGYLTEKTEDRTLDVMDFLGWNGSTQFEAGSFDADKTVSLTIEREVGQDGVERPKIQWVNDPDRPRGSSIENDESAVANLNLKAKLAARRAGKKTTQPNMPFGAAPSFDSSEELPF